MDAIAYENWNVGRVQKAVTALTSGWRNSPPVTVVNYVDDLPHGGYSDTAGQYFRGNIWLVAENLDKRNAVPTLAHEAIGHHGMREVFGREWHHLMRCIRLGIEGGDTALSAARGEVRLAYVDEAGERYLPSMSESDEVAALYAETLACSETGALRVKNPIRKQFRALAKHITRSVLHIDTAIDSDELQGALLLAERHLRRMPPGTKRAKIAGWLARCYIGGMPKFDVHKPPMSLDESQKLLAAEKRRLLHKGEFWGAAQLFGGFGLLLACLGYIGYRLLSFLAHL